MEHTEKKKQRKQETQYLKSLFLNKKYDGEAKSASKRKTGEAAASVLSTTVAAAWSWITEKPPAEETKETKESKRGSGAKSGSSSSSGGSGKGTATQRVKSSGVATALRLFLTLKTPDTDQIYAYPQDKRVAVTLPRRMWSNLPTTKTATVATVTMTTATKTPAACRLKIRTSRWYVSP